MKFKHLLRKMGLETLIEEANRENWIIPTSEQLIGQNIDYDEVWTIDGVSVKEYTNEDIKHGVKLGYLFDVKAQKAVIVNQNFMMKCVIIKDENE